jgi:hypothetical protein
MIKSRGWATAGRTAGIFVLTILFSAAQAPWALAARPRGDKARCKKIQQAVRRGDTLEQIMTDFQVDAQQVMTCTQTKGKRRKQKATNPPRSTPAGSLARPPRIAKAGKRAAPPAR